MTLKVLKMPKGMCRGRAKGKGAARRRLPMETVLRTSETTETTLPGRPSTQISECPSSPPPPPPVPPTPPELWKEGDTFSTMLNEYSGWKASRLTSRKEKKDYYAALYHDDLPDPVPEDEDEDNGDDAGNIFKDVALQGQAKCSEKVFVLGGKNCCALQRAM